ncbi:MAG: adenosine deaminase [Acidobacteriia bacterium]|nr:adenosine deaminase [Terriglobia bacterium]
MSPWKLLPKVELHLHLEGSVWPQDVRELARRNHLPSAELPAKAFARQFQYSDFPGFLLAFKSVTEHLCQPRDYAWVAGRLMDRLGAQSVIYAEIFISGGVILKQRKPLDEIVEAVCEVTRTDGPGKGTEVNWILDITRQFGRKLAEEVVDAAIRLRAAGLDNLVGVGMGGDENSIEANEFKHALGRAREAGLRITIHAGEVAGPNSIWEALDILKAERIGHGLAARQDERLMRHLAEKSILLECALTSNVKTGALQRIEDHPLKHFLRSGLAVSLNTDDPALFSTDLEKEYDLAETALGFTREDFVSMNRSALEHSFTSPGSRASLLELFERRLSSPQL